MKKLYLILTFLFLFLFASTSWGAIEYVDPGCGTPGNGSTGTCDNDANDPHDEWSDITFNAANDYYQLCGTTDTIATRVLVNAITATSGNRMVLGAYYIDGSEVIGVSGNKPIIDRNGVDDGCIWLQDSHYVDIENLELKKGGITLKIYGGSYHRIHDCIIGEGAFTDGIKVSESTIRAEYIEIYNNLIDLKYATYVAGSADAVDLGDGTQYCKIYENTIKNSNHAGVQIINTAATFPTVYNEVYNNLIEEDDGTTDMACYYVMGALPGMCSFNKFYLNMCKNTNTQFQINGDSNEVYTNITYGTIGGGQPNGISFDDVNSQLCEYNRAHNNTVYGAEETGIIMNTSDTNVQYNEIINNIVVACDSGASNYQLYIHDIATVLDNIYKNNLLYSSATSDVVYYGHDAGDNYPHTVAEFNAQNGTAGDVISGNIFGSPNFVNTGSGDFSIRGGYGTNGATTALLTGSETMAAQNNSDFSSGSAGAWGITTNGTPLSTVAYDTTDVGGIDDKQLKVTFNDDGGASYVLTKLDAGYFPLSQNTSYRIYAHARVPAANTNNIVTMQTINIGTSIYVDKTLDDDTWTILVIDLDVITDTSGSLQIGFAQNDPTNGDIVYIDNIYIKEQVALTTKPRPETTFGVGSNGLTMEDILSNGNYGVSRGAAGM